MQAVVKSLVLFSVKQENRPSFGVASHFIELILLRAHHLIVQV